MDKEYYYGVTRTDDYLAHYGVRGMKWGVRRALSRKSDRALAKQYKKAAKKLAKLDRRAASGKQYARRAAALGAGAALAGGVAATGTEGIYKALNKYGNAGAKAVGAGGKVLQKVGSRVGGKVGGAMSRVGEGIYGGSRAAGAALTRAGTSARTWGYGNSATNAIRGSMIKAAAAKGGKVGSVLNSAQGKLRGVSNNTIARVGAGAAAAGLAGGAAYNAYRAATTKRAARKAAEFRKEMNQTFAGTKYGAPRRKRRR